MIWSGHTWQLKGRRTLHQWHSNTSISLRARTGAAGAGAREADVQYCRPTILNNTEQIQMMLFHIVVVLFSFVTVYNIEQHLQY